MNNEAKCQANQYQSPPDCWYEGSWRTTNRLVSMAFQITGCCQFWYLYSINIYVWLFTYVVWQYYYHFRHGLILRLYLCLSTNIRKQRCKQDCIPVGIPPARWPYLPVCSARRGGGCLPGPGGACLVQGGAFLVPGGFLPGPGGACLVGGGGIPACTEADSPCEQNHRCL